jgi:recombinational DNA repair protein RecR
MNPAYTKSLNNLIEQFAKLPGIGPKTAERLVFHISNPTLPRRWPWPRRFRM